MADVPEILEAPQSFTFDIRNEKDGRFAVLTFFALPNAAANSQNKIIARFALQYEAFAAMPGLIQELIRQNESKFLKK